MDAVQRRVEEAAIRGFMDKAFDDDVVETAIQCLYGPRNKFWDWHRQLESNS